MTNLIKEIRDNKLAWLVIFGIPTLIVCVDVAINGTW